MNNPDARSALMAGTAAGALWAILPAAALAEERYPLGTVQLPAENRTTTLEGSRTVLGRDSMQIRSDGSGDANTALTSLPNVQYRDDTDSDAGQNSDDLLNLKPLELSISGGRVTENNFMLDGVGINSLTGNESPTTSSDLSRQTGNPGSYTFYGLHSQTQFVPSAMVDSFEVWDSNIPARFGGFQGGVVDYRLTEPSAGRASGRLVFDYHSDALVDYKLGTEDGDNPLDMPKPEFTTLQYSAEFNQPLGERTAMILGFGRRWAEASKAMDPQYRSGLAENDSRSDFWRLRLAHELQGGGKISFGGMLTDYSQGWDSNYIEDYHLDVDTRGLSLDAGYEREWTALRFAGLGLSNVRLTLKAIHQDNRAENLNDQSEFYSWYGAYFSTLRGIAYSTDAFDAWCDAPDAPRQAEDYVACLRGGYGSKTYRDARDRIEAQLQGDVWRGSFSLGAALEWVDAGRSGTGFTSYTSSTYPGAFGSFTCPPGDPACIDDQYLRIRITQNPYDVEVSAKKAEAYFELDQSWGDFGLRAGLRTERNDVLKNTDLAPRLSASWTPSPDFALTLGANRYYSGSYLSYAIHDALPRGVNQSRTHNSTTGVVGDWGAPISLNAYYYTQGDLKTPHVDEGSLALMYRDPWTGGNWRLKVIDRQGKDQFARSQDSTSLVNRLTNDGTNEYRSVSLEYQKRWAAGQGGALDDLSLYVSGVWSSRRTSNDSYFGELGDDGTDDFIWYDDRSYTRGAFDAVTGNRDIPVRATVELASSWRDERFRLGVGADIAFGYTAAIDTGTTGTFVNPEYGSRPHDIYADFDFDAAVSTFLSGKVRLARLQGGDLDLNVKVSNLFNDLGNRTATTRNPWMPGRAIHVGTSYTW
ncbi:TonB-dependent receptor [Rhodovulum strictum]|uniref:TonB-dependent receptor plug domain-containing protein n=1 Tax=Rhodovulum strictum TaxID=58314 RepID=A0A844BH18_9RHOB|nr:TonB-dependent receptor plug domain-containing protein [Rhodovulum strictum]MRH21798.1 TonB-dependent receptor plug domain-containing protein [Rhodovulum strictum]